MYQWRMMNRVEDGSSQIVDQRTFSGACVSSLHCLSAMTWFPPLVVINSTTTTSNLTLTLPLGTAITLHRRLSLSLSLSANTRINSSPSSMQ
mmetsp:Transcript_28244/g.68724  ORF Transcript_28244/g.68724 Transcript_28244/m.68724 type:complete len:92 (+) Transcript_28244:1191-1466(+)